MLRGAISTMIGKYFLGQTLLIVLCRIIFPMRLTFVEF